MAFASGMSSNKALSPPLSLSLLNLEARTETSGTFHTGGRQGSGR